MAREYLLNKFAQETLQVFGGTAEDVFGVYKVNGANILAFSKGRPCMLVDALERGTPLKWSNESTVQRLLDPDSPEMQAVIGPSGVGKTSTILRALILKFGCYLEAYTGVGSAGFMHLLDKDFRHPQLSETEGLRLLQAVHLSLLLVLEAFRKLVPTCTPKQWTYLMLTASSGKFRHHTDVNEMVTTVSGFTRALDSSRLQREVDRLKRKFKCPRLFLDEAQQYLRPEYGDFKGPTESGKRPILSALLHPGIVVSGTGLRLQLVAELMGSHVMKPGDTSPVKAGEHSPHEDNKVFQRRKASQQCLLTVPGCALSDVKSFASLYDISLPSSCDAALEVLCGRARLVARFTQTMLESAPSASESELQRCIDTTTNDFVTSLQAELDRHLTEDVVIQRRGMPSLSYEQLAQELLCCAIWHGGRFERSCDEVIDFVDASMCMLRKENGNLVAYINEKVAIRALLNFSECKGWNVALNKLVEHMLSGFTGASARGFDMECLFVVDVAMRILKPGVSGDEKWDGFGDKRVEAWPQWRSPGAFTVIDCRMKSTEFTSLYDFLVAAEAGKFEDEQDPVFCLPEEAAGPDVVTLVWVLNDDGSKSKALWFTQCKRLAQPLGGKDFTAAVRTCWWDNLYATAKHASQHTEYLQQKARALCKDTFGANSFFLSTLCVVPGLTKPAAKERMESPPGTRWTVLDQNKLKRIMSERGYRAASANMRANRRVPTDKVVSEGNSMGNSIGNSNCGGGGGGSNETNDTGSPASCSEGNSDNIP